MTEDDVDVSPSLQDKVGCVTLTCCLTHYVLEQSYIYERINKQNYYNYSVKIILDNTGRPRVIKQTTSAINNMCQIA